MPPPWTEASWKIVKDSVPQGWTIHAFKSMRDAVIVVEQRRHRIPVHPFVAPDFSFLTPPRSWH